MSKVIIFSRVFPAYHPRKGEPTNFIEKLNAGLGLEYGIAFGDQTEKLFSEKGVEYSHKTMASYLTAPKYHTIRSGHRWNVGDKFSPRVWRGKPYKSSQVIIAPDITIVNIWEFQIRDIGSTNRKPNFLTEIKKEGYWHAVSNFYEIAKNDGLCINDFFEWFKFPSAFCGQIICWSDKVKY